LEPIGLQRFKRFFGINKPITLQACYESISIIFGALAADISYPFYVNKTLGN